MNINIDKFIKLNDLVSLSFLSKHIIVLNPDEYDENIQETDEIVYDKTGWEITDEYKKYIEELSKNNKLSNEEKILDIFQKICKDYIYDDNLISYLKKVDDDTFSLPDWYGRDIDDEWKMNRETHNRRVCYELSRFLAKSLKDIFKNNEDFNICIYWNENLTHYFVGLTCSEYSITLDPDDFFNIKDLTRLKVGLTAKGIRILEDNENKFGIALNNFNEGREEYAIVQMEDEIKKDSTENQNSNETVEQNEEILFLNKVLEILTNKYDIDSQGIFEYMKEIVDIKLGTHSREKLWKKIEGDNRESTRYIRCLLINVDNKKYLIDVDEKVLRVFDEEELNKKRPSFIHYKELSRGDFDYYDGR